MHFMGFGYGGSGSWLGHLRPRLDGERPLALDRHTIALALVRPVIPDGHVQRAAIIPHRDVVLPPLKARLVPRTLGVLKQKLKNRATLLFRQSLDSRRKGAIHEQ